jgi:[acyl-carrier-protein] S-malonyltransferase
MLFPGQGAQSMGMQSELAEQYDDVCATYAEASELLGYDLWALVQDGPAEELDNTVVTQPAMLTAGVAAWRVWRSAGGAIPAYMAGHSLGEYTALVCSGALEFAAAVPLVKRRAELMQDAVPAGEGAMAAILGLDDDQVKQVCEASSQGAVVSAVNFNSPGQVVIAGEKQAVERAAEAAKEAGAKRALLLSVSVPSHCTLMKPAADRLAETLANTHFESPSVPVINNVDVAVYQDASDIRDGLQRQLCNPVRWSETITYLIAQGVDKMLDAGPGRVLAGLSRRIDRSVTAVGLDNPANLEKAIQSFAAVSNGVSKDQLK